MWTVQFYNLAYYIQNMDTMKSIKVEPLTEQEIKERRYQQYYDKAHVACDMANGETVYLNRHLKNGKIVMYRYTPKQPKK